MHRKSTAALLGALLAAFVLAAPLAHAQDAAASPPAACVTDPPAAGAPIVVTGSGARHSAPFALDGGAYHATWKSDKTPEAFSYIHLKSADGSTPFFVDTVYTRTSGDDGARDGDTYVYNVKPGTYYLDVRLPAGWSVTLTPIAA